MMAFRARLSALLPVALSLLGCEAFRGEPSVDELIGRHTAAAGGAAAIEAVRGVEIALRIWEPTFEVDGVFKADRQGRMRIDIFADGQRVFTEAYDGERARQWSGDATEPREASPQGTAALRHSVQLPGTIFGLHELERNGHRVVLEGRETLDDIDYYVVRITLDDGHETFRYLDPDSYLIARSRDLRALHPDLDPSEQWIESRSSDYRMVHGLMRSFRSENVDLRSGEVIQRVTIQRIAINPEIDPLLFSRL